MKALEAFTMNKSVCLLAYLPYGCLFITRLCFLMCPCISILQSLCLSICQSTCHSICWTFCWCVTRF